ncbi:MAG: hypothetical protein K0S76_261 [Herbinix sp.]|jgi:MGT family glycosyltransferase|nr:hypothetical protein [Herbinix sp.]
MSNILFVNGSIHGHINPTLPVVKELVRRGEEVTYFSTIDFKQKIEETGAIFMDYGPQLTQFFQNFRPRGNHPFYSLIEFMLAMDRVVIPIVLQKTTNIKFDYIIHDVMFGGGNILSRLLNLTAIATCSSFVMERLPIPDHMLEPGFHPQLDCFFQEFEAAKNEWAIGSYKITDLFFKKENLNFVFTSKLFQPMGDSFDDTYRFVGPSISDRDEVPDFVVRQTEEEKIIYISLGTINNQYISFYHQCMDAFREESVKVIMSVGTKTDLSALHPIPDNFVIRNYIPQLEVLKQADVFISHGGLNSVSEALFYGVPVIAIPLANDQPMVARRLTELRAGCELKMTDITPELLRDTVHSLLSDQAYKHSTIKVKDSFLQAGGYATAVNEILRFISDLQN